MGFFKKDKAAPAPGGSDDSPRIGVSGMMANPAVLGGPSTTPLSPDDPLLQPIDGIGLAEYAAVAREAQSRGVTTEEGVAQIAQEQGHDPQVFAAAAAEWVSRMGQSMVVGQEFRRHLGV
ncbi:MAG: hypothetical protein JJLCMIEE_02835 [Acidimicrobiales bacterium]|nr:MAG: hypothetical protein EDR02_13645 [Actinomycetota bacterium]MBV6509737.1 hypothetical protein [Acidimicrobiales bacterium]RIK04869.1 MAG: hypothetical protein DCC48_12585 [Acidobacteriota bacterium]